jgi:hypothetical protein
MAEEKVCTCVRELSELLTQAAWGIEDVVRGRWDTAKWRFSTQIEPGVRRLEKCLSKELKDIDWILEWGRKYIDERSESSSLLFLGALIAETPYATCKVARE